MKKINIHTEISFATSHVTLTELRTLHIKEIYPVPHYIATPELRTPHYF